MAARVTSSSPEQLAIRKNYRSLCDGVTKVLTVTPFALSLLERGFITSDAKINILQMRGTSPQQQVDMFLDAVMEQVGLDPTKFQSFVDIFRCEAALSFCADLMTNTYGM